jgi:hypothetical protein
VAAAYAGTTLLILATLALAGVTDRPLAYFTREPVEALRREGELCSSFSCSYAGFLSNVGVLVVFAACVCCLWSAYLLRRRPRVANRPGTRMFLAAGALTAAVALDDLFLIHENVLPELISIGEDLAYVAYLIAGAAFAYAFREALRHTELALLVAGAAFLGCSVFADVALDHRHLIEDGAKLYGYVSVTLYFALTGLREIEGRDEPPRTRAAPPGPGTIRPGRA